VAPPWKDVADNCTARSTQRCELRRGTRAAAKLWEPQHTPAGKPPCRDDSSAVLPYVAKLPAAIHALSAFEKKTRKTPQRELTLAPDRSRSV